MESKIIQPFYDMEKKGARGTPFFFLEHVLKARGDLNMESGRHTYDQEVNVYLAGLLNSLVESSDFLHQKPYVSPFDADVRGYLEDHPGLRTQYTVYRDNADFGVVLLGIFLGYEHHGSYNRQVLASTDEKGKVALYYELAASALMHLQGKSVSLVSVFEAMSENMAEILQVLRQAAASYFDMIERISEGSIYHLQKDMDEISVQRRYNEKIDEFLKKYSRYKDDPSEPSRQELLALADELQKLNAKFNFDKSNLGA